MAKWIQPLSKVAAQSAASRNLRDEEVVKALMEQAGVQDKVKKASFLERLSSAFGAFEWTDDALKTAKKGGNFLDFLGSYALDVPRTIAGNIIDKTEWIDPGEAKGVELMKYLGVRNKAAQYVLGTAADIAEPSMLISGLIKGGSTLTKTGSSFIDDLAKVGAKNTDDAIKLLGKEFGEKAAKSAAKRVASGDDILNIAGDYITKSGVEKGFVKTLDPGLYLGTSAQKGIPILKGTVPSYIARMIDTPLIAPYEIGWDIAKKTGLTDTKVVSRISKGLEKSLFKNFDFQHVLKKEGSETLSKLGSQVHSITNASQYAGDKAARNLQDFIKSLPVKQQEEFLNVSLGDLIEGGAGLARKTTVDQYMKFLKNSEILDNKSYSSILERVKEAGLKDMNFDDLKQLIDSGTTMSGQMATGIAGKVNLEQILGTRTYNIFMETLETIPQKEATWNKLVNDIGLPGKTIESIDDVKQLRAAIAKSNLDSSSKEFYSRVADIFEQNIKDSPYRKALNLGDYKAGYIKRFYDVESTEDLPEGIKKGVIDTKERLIPSGTALEIYNKYSPYKLSEEVGASRLLKQISDKEAQSVAVKNTYDLYKVLTEQVEEGLMPKFGIEGVDKIPKTWKETGIPMLDKAGIRVDPKIWEVIRDTNKVLVGDVNVDSILGLPLKFNTLWRGLTTAMTVNVFGKEVPLNPAYYVRNWMNNKFANVLYGGMDPIKVYKRTGQGAKVWSYLETGKGGDTLIGDYSVKDIAQKYIKQGGLAGTDIGDITRDLDLTKGLGDKLKGLQGSGDFARKLENIDKIALFIDQKLKNVDDIAAMNKVRFSLFDYGQLTDFEKTSVKPLFAFYTWQKKNFVSFFATLAKDPKRVKVFDDIFKGFRQLSDEMGTDIEEILPDYLKEAYSLIIGDKNEVGAVYGFGTNIEAVGDIIGRDWKETAQGLLGALSPAQRIIFETSTDYNFFKQKPISEDTSAYAYRNLPDALKDAIGIQGSTFTDDSGKEVTVYKMNPAVKYAIENFRPATSLLKMFNIATNEGVNGEMFFDLMNYLSGVRYQQYDTEYLRRQYENERYKERMQMLMDEGYVNEYKNYYIPKEK